MDEELVDSQGISLDREIDKTRSLLEGVVRNSE